jgi:nucleoside-diphosphate-sugar epimerase
MRVLIVGCGYVGLPLGAELARLGHEVYGLRRSLETSDLTRAGIKPIVGDITQPALLPLLQPNFDWVVNTISSSQGGVEDYRAVYLEGTKRLVEWLQGAGSLGKYVYTSSTSVYAQADGSWVTEESPTDPKSETSRVLVETESVLLDQVTAHGFPAVILRLAGIYGPGRGHLFHQLLRGEARLADGGSRLINMIHRDDAAGAILAALERGSPGEVYNVVDDEPVTQRDFFQWLVERLGLPIPPVAEATESAGRKRGVTNKRVSNRKLRLALACELKYPTFRQGYAAEIAGLQEAGRRPGGGK